jgi:hypothetical protein
VTCRALSPNTSATTTIGTTSILETENLDPLIIPLAIGCSAPLALILAVIYRKRSRNTLS